MDLFQLPQLLHATHGTLNISETPWHPLNLSQKRVRKTQLEKPGAAIIACIASWREVKNALN